MMISIAKIPRDRLLKNASVGNRFINRTLAPQAHRVRLSPTKSLRSFLIAQIAMVCAFLIAAPAVSFASITVLVGEPFGKFGARMPMGHVTIYLDRVCADGPLKLRMCDPAEPQGVAIARYKNLGGVDWIATPITQFLYAVDRPEDAPGFVTPELAWEMRQAYRKEYLSTLIPNGSELDKSTLEWRETAGAAFDRRLWGYQVRTTPEKDRAFVDWMNSATNHHRYRLRMNCANFAADAVNFYFPGAVPHADRIADLGWMTPKHVARCLNAYGVAHPNLGLRVIEVDQIPGSIPRSGLVRGLAEAALKTKRYLAALLLIQPEVPLTLAFLYLCHGRWEIGDGAQRIEPSALRGQEPGAPLFADE